MPKKYPFEIEIEKMGNTNILVAMLVSDQLLHPLQRQKLSFPLTLAHRDGKIVDYNLDFDRCFDSVGNSYAIELNASPGQRSIYRFLGIEAKPTVLKMLNGEKIIKKEKKISIIDSTRMSSEPYMGRYGREMLPESIYGQPLKKLDY